MKLLKWLNQKANHHSVCFFRGLFLISPIFGRAGVSFVTSVPIQSKSLSVWKIKQNPLESYFTWKNSYCKANTQAFNQLAENSFLCPFTVKQCVSDNAAVMDLVADVPFQSGFAPKEVNCHRRYLCWTADVFLNSFTNQCQDLGWRTRKHNHYWTMWNVITLISCG